MFDYHLHTEFSFDCTERPKNNIESALKKGIKELCFTDHCDFESEYNGKYIDNLVDYKAFNPIFESLKQKYKGVISLKKGVELGVQPHTLERAKTLIDTQNFDFVLMSMHDANKKDLYDQSFFVGKTTLKSWQVYLDEFTYCAKHLNDYSVLGHLDLLKRYNDDAADFDDALVKDRYMKLFETLVKKGKGLEINTCGFDLPRVRNFQPTPNILNWYYEAGGQILTLGSDAHKSKYIGRYFKDAIKTLKEIGFTSIYRFDKMQPIEVKFKDM